MSTLIIPSAGGARLDGVPTCLARHPDGSYLFEKSIAGLDRSGVDRIILTVLADEFAAFDIENKISASDLGVKAEVCVLPSKTSGPAATVYETIKRMNVVGTIIIKDVDNFMVVPRLAHANFAAGLDVFDYDIRNLKTKSFVTVNEQNNILDLIEKQIKSNIICGGLYGFSSADDFVRAYEALLDPNYGISSLYVSHVITYLIGRFNQIFRFVKVDSFESYGSQDEWDEFKRHALGTAKKTRLALFDMDGTLFDTNEINYRAYKEALAHHGVDFERDYWYEHCIGVHYKDFVRPLGVTDEKILLDIHARKKEAYPKYLRYAKVNARLFELIELIRPQYYIALVTTASSANVYDILDAFDKRSVFDKMFMQEDVSKMKPDPECYFKAMEYFDIPPERTIIFEDSASGLAAAEASGAFYYKVFRFN